MCCEASRHLLILLPPSSPVFYLKALNEFTSEPNKSCIVNQRVGVNWLRNILVPKVWMWCPIH